MAENDESPRAMTPDERKQQKSRNLAIGLSLGAFVVIVFLVTMLKLMANAQQG